MYNNIKELVEKVSEDQEGIDYWNKESGRNAVAVVENAYNLIGVEEHTVLLFEDTVKDQVRVVAHSDDGENVITVDHGVTINFPFTTSCLLSAVNCSSEKESELYMKQAYEAHLDHERICEGLGVEDFFKSIAKGA